MRWYLVCNSLTLAGLDVGSALQRLDRCLQLGAAIGKAGALRASRAQCSPQLGHLGTQRCCICKG